jgi:hypothetical protein
LGQPDLVVLGEKWMACNVSQVKAEEIRIGTVVSSLHSPLSIIGLPRADAWAV